MKRAFIVCGAEHSGNRLVAGMLAAGGCAGRGSDDQPKREDVEKWEDDQIVVIAHLKNDIANWYYQFEDRGYQVHFIVTVRDPWVQVRSRSEAAQASLEESMKRYREDYLAAFSAIEGTGCGFTFIPYESFFALGSVKRFLSLFDLTLDGPLIVQGEEVVVRNENEKWYAGS